jgi:RNA polymerase primary sigma factor
MRLIRSAPPLTPEEEDALGNRIDAGRRAEKRLKDLNGAELINVEEIRKCKATVREADSARRQLVERSLRFAAYLALRYQHRGVAVMDLIQDANIALIKAADRWEHHPEYRFAALAAKYIEGALKKSCYESCCIHLAPDMARAVIKINIVSRIMMMQLTHWPSAKEIADEMLLPIDLVKKIETASLESNTPSSLDKPVDEEEETTLGDLIPDRSAKTPEYLVMSGMLREKVESILATLEPEEEKVIRLRFGFEDGAVHTQEQIGRVFSWDVEDVRLTEAKAMRKLRHPSRSGQLVGFLN